MDIGISDINYSNTAATVVFGVLLALIVRALSQPGSSDIWCITSGFVNVPQ